MLTCKREHRWRCAWSLVTLDDARPCNGVAHPDARRLRVRPEFEVLGTIVVLDAVRRSTSIMSVSPAAGFGQVGSDAIQCVRYDSHVVTLRILNDFLQI
jgi:hypothetical protein